MFKNFTLIILCICGLAAHAQEYTTDLEKLYIHNQANGNGIALHQNKIFEKDQGVLVTSRDSINTKQTQVLFSRKSHWEGASNVSYIDGFVKSNHDSAFVFPIGSNGSYKPIACSKPKGVTAAYFTKDSSFYLEDSINSVKLLDKSSYWAIKGDKPTSITLSWNANDSIAELVNKDITKLKIVGFNGALWEVIESDVDVLLLDTKTSKVNYLEAYNDLNEGTITTLNEIVPNTYIAYNIAIVGSIESINKNTISNGNEEIEKYADISNFRKIKSIYFPFKESEVTTYSTYLLKRLAKMLEGNDPKIKLVGHADFYGPNDLNYQLGLDRANAVKAMLSNFGLDVIEVEVISNGEDVLENDCETCSSRETLIDRRVDVYLYGY